MSKQITVWTFSSDSNPNKTYETLLYSDNTTSCNCPGWTQRVGHDGSRTCKHTRLVDQGIADQESVSNHSYQPGSAPQKIQTPPVATTQKTKLATTGHRKIRWN